MRCRCRIAVVVASVVLLCGSADRGFSAEPKLNLDHFKVYKIAVGKKISAGVTLQGQFDKRPRKAKIEGPVMFANPVSKNGSQILDKNAHLTVYFFESAEPEPGRAVVIRNQFFDFKPQTVLIGNPGCLFVPATKRHKDEKFPMSKQLDHYKCYKVLEGEAAKAPVELVDQFEKTGNVAVKPVLFGVPVSKEHDGTITEIKNKRDHLVIYELEKQNTKPVVKFEFKDQFDGLDAEAHTRVFLCVPSLKLEYKETTNPK